MIITYCTHQTFVWPTPFFFSLFLPFRDLICWAWEFFLEIVRRCTTLQFLVLFYFFMLLKDSIVVIFNCNWDMEVLKLWFVKLDLCWLFLQDEIIIPLFFYYSVSCDISCCDILYTFYALQFILSSILDIVWGVGCFIWYQS